MTDFEPIRAKREEIAGLFAVSRTIGNRKARLQSEYSVLEHELDAVSMLHAYVTEELRKKQLELRKLES